MKVLSFRKNVGGNQHTSLRLRRKLLQLVVRFGRELPRLLSRVLRRTSNAIDSIETGTIERVAKIGSCICELGEEKEFFLGAIHGEKIYERLQLVVFCEWDFSGCA